MAISESSAQNTQLAVSEAKEWIEAVTEMEFKNGSIRESLEDGVLLCKLMNRINPGFIKRINNFKSPIAYLDNIQQFLLGCQNLGLKDAQLFDVMDLQDIKSVQKKKGVKRDEADRRIRGVCITLYWLGRTVADLDDYNGPQLELDHFKILMDENKPAVEDKVKETDVTLDAVHDYLDSNQLENFQIPEETQSPMPTATSNGSMSARSIQENGLMLTFEQEQTADELLADIQNAVDEMLENFHLNPMPTTYPPTSPPQPVNPDTERKNSTDESSVKSSACHDEIDGGSGAISKFSHTVKMLSRRKSGFGFQVMGGVDSSIPAQVDYIVPGSIAENAGLKVGDILLCVNDQVVSDFSHVDLVEVIKQAGCTGEVMIQVERAEESRSYQDGASPGHTPQNNAIIPDALNISGTESCEQWVEENDERMQQAQEISLMNSQRNAGSLDNEITNGPPPSYAGRKSLPTLVEHHEEALFEEIQEMMESVSHSLSLEATPSSFLPLQKSYSEPPPREHMPTSPSPFQDNMESIEHELQELVLMETTEYQAQDYSLSDSASEEGGQVSDKKVGVEKAADTVAIKFNSFEVEESHSPLPLSHIHEIPMDIEILQIAANSPRETPTQSPPHPDDAPVFCSPEISSDKPMTKSIKFSEDNSKPVPLMTAPPVMMCSTEEFVTLVIDLSPSPPPKPKSKAPIRVIRRPAPLPPPPSPKSGLKQTLSLIKARNASTPENDETIPAINGNDNPLLQPSVSLEHVSKPQQACSPPQDVSSPQEYLLTGQTNASTPQQDTPTPKHAPSPQEDVSSPKHAPSPQEDASRHAPSPQEDVSSPKHVPSHQEEVSSPKHAPSRQEDVSSPKHAPDTQEGVSSPKYAPSLQPQKSDSSPILASNLIQASPPQVSSPLQDLFTKTSFQRSDSPDLVTQMLELAYSKTISVGLEPSTSTQDTTKKQKNDSPPGRSIQKDNSKLQVTPQAQHEQQQQPPLGSQKSDSIDSSIDPAAVEAPTNMTFDPSTPNSIEIMGDIRIQHVQKTRWTPAESSSNNTAVTTKPVLHKHPDRSATLPSTHCHNEMSKSINSSPTHEKRMQVEMNDTGTTKRLESSGANVTVPRGIGGGISGRARKAQEQKKSPLRSNSYQPQALQKKYQQQMWGSQEEIRKQKLNPGNKPQKYATTPNGTSSKLDPGNKPQKYATIPAGTSLKLDPGNKPQKYATTSDGTTSLRLQQGKSLSMEPINDYKKNRSMTWSVTKDRGVMDGFQVAYAMHATCSSDLCSCCHQPLGKGVVLSLPMLKAQYHTKCFTCCVCRSPLGQETRNIKVLMKNKQPYCRLCASSDNGMLTTEC